ncbi:formylglycine-generating enzyme family protein, partial [Marivita sp. S2033]|uniref:formylglycine-generating enzyme family protein n=1 Tax=Marivita sp. S2033 TaxID=3373187 RepID=UPI0039819C16
FLKRLRSVEHDDYSLYDEVSDALKTRFENCALGIRPIADPWPDFQVFRDCDLFCPEMIVLPAGDFNMGAPNSDPEPESWERPVQQISVSKFALGRTEVTFREFDIFALETSFQYSEDCEAPDERGNWSNRNRDEIDRLYGATNGFDPKTFPVNCISYFDAKSYLDWLNSKVDGAPFRLPSEAELEYAIRAGTGGTYAWGDDLSRACEFANGPDETLLRNFPDRTLSEHLECRDGFPSTSPVAYFKPNGFKLFDTVGNVSEWTEDCYVDGLIGIPLDGSPRRDDDCNTITVRGGSWGDYSPKYLRASFRRGRYKSEEHLSIGFRIARDLE